MKKYEKPTLEVVKLRVEENIAATGKATIYKMAESGDGAGTLVGKGIAKDAGGIVDFGS